MARPALQCWRGAYFLVVRDGSGEVHRALRRRPAALVVQPRSTQTGAAVLSAMALGLPLLALVLAGRPQAAVFAAFGAFTGLYAADRPYRLRARTLAAVAAGFVAAVALGSAGGMVLTQGGGRSRSRAAAAAKWGCDTAGSAPGPGCSCSPSRRPRRCRRSRGRGGALAAGLRGAAVAWCVAMLGALVDPRAPEFRATATALGRRRRCCAWGKGRHRGTGTPRRRHCGARSGMPQPPRLARRALAAALVRAEALLTDAVLAPADPMR